MTADNTSSGAEEPLSVACDESGNDGENLLAGGSRFFVHASVTISDLDATAIMAEVRSQTGSQSVELKSKTLLQRKDEATARWLLELPELRDHASLHITDKRYFLVSKLFDATIEELAHEDEYDMFADGAALCGANILFFTSPALFGERWEALLVAFQSFLRARSTSEAAATLRTFDGHVVDVLAAGVSPGDMFFSLIHAGVRHLRTLSRLQLGEGIDHRLRTLDPLIPALGAAVLHWATQSGRPVEVLHDAAKELTPERIEAMRKHLAAPEIVSPNRAGKGVELVNVTLADSKLEARVQVADLLAGLGRSVLEAESYGKRHPLTPLVEGFISRLSVIPNPEMMNPDTAKAVAESM
ncbi:DUF3800 domain-containing protein [Microbacterium sp. TNHR37B]|uniref:DUF3800 domain-containing protein n=1 Tax=Microbacterium sp. TNHR37B TaxID=1775956 RepID=UPI0007B29B82|nr:DUF3800 domain-containing protein [Microbacterium sp. TNHR37B]KZE91620.1 hypothetical protein AVP41_01164 [Microbacterium sp. TNHR37B]